MRVHIAYQVLEDEANWPSVDSLILLFLSGRHQWVGDPDRVRASAWYQAGVRRRVDDLLRDMECWRPSKPRKQGPHRLQVMVVSGATPEDQEPAFVRIGVRDVLAALGGTFALLEDATNDAGFLHWVVRHANLRHLPVDFTDALMRDLDTVTPAGTVVRVQNGGGSNTPKELRRLYPVRAPIFVLVDSDRTGPGPIPPGKTADSVQRVFKDLGEPASVVVQVLEWREAENYLPDGFLAGYAREHEKRKVHAALRNRSVGDRARWYDMEEGIPSGRDAAWADLEPQLVDALRPGFGHGIKAAVRRLVSCEEPPHHDAAVELARIAQSLFDML